MKRFISPREAAISLGVSESSLKRWCDRGVIEMQRTEGGHRRIPIASMISFLRQNQRELRKPEVIGLPRRVKETTKSLFAATEPITNSLAQGDIDTCQEIVFGFFLSGKSVAEICDELLTPALFLIGERWNHGKLEIYEEHRAVAMTVRVLHELRVAMEPAKHRAPVAIGGTATGDVYGLPTQMIELALLETGWNALSLGTSLPFHTITRAITENKPKLFWLSVSAVADDKLFQQQLRQFEEEASKSTSVFVGGRALTLKLREQLELATCCDNIQQLVELADLEKEKQTN